jgi:hypothetical protein
MRVDDINQVTGEENNLLTCHFSEEEVRETVFQIEHNKAPDPDGFLAEFYQACWDIVKSDLMTLFIDFHAGKLPLHSLNFDIIILLLKCRDSLKLFCRYFIEARTGFHHGLK